MTTTSTRDTLASVAQARRIIEAGGELVRFTTQGRLEAENMKNIRQALRSEGYDTPLVADVHMNADVADVAALCCEKVRINPGNYVDPARKFQVRSYTDEEYTKELDRIDKRFTPFLSLCKEHDTAIRIGVNHGSLSDRIRNRYGDSEEGIVESCMEYLRVCQRENFHNVVLSVKASNTVMMVKSTRRLLRAMESEDMYYPLHLGVTEAGEGEDGRVKSAVGIGALLTEGVGDTIRVSLSEEPEKEIPVARKMVNFIEECTHLRETAKIDHDVLYLDFAEDSHEDLLLKASMASGALLIDGKARHLELRNRGKRCHSLEDAILQAARVKFSKTEFISCPGCGRTLYDLRSTVAKIKQALAHEAESDPRVNSLKIAVMGCIVNGPGEMADADYGYVGAGKNTVALYKGKNCVKKAIAADNAVASLLELIRTTINKQV